MQWQLPHLANDCIDLANNWQIKRALPTRQTIASRVAPFTIHNIPEFSRKLTYFLNTDVASENDDFFFFLFCWICWLLTRKHIQF